MNTLKKINIILEEFRNNDYNKIVIDFKTNNIIFNNLLKRKIKMDVNVFFDFISYIEFYYKENEIKTYIKNNFIDKLKQFSNDGYNKNYHYSIGSDIMKSKLLCIIYELKHIHTKEDNKLYNKIIINLNKNEIIMKGKNNKKNNKLNTFINIISTVEFIVSYESEVNDIMSWIRENNGDAKKFRNLIK